MKRSSMICALLLCMALVMPAAASPIATETVRFDGIGMTLSLPVDWMYMDITSGFAEGVDEPIEIDGEPVDVSAYVMMTNTAQTMSVTVMAIRYGEDMDVDAEIEALVIEYGEMATLRKIGGVTFCIYPYEAGGLAAVAYAQQNVITLYANLQEGTDGATMTVDAFLSQFGRIVDSIRFVP